MRSGLRWLWLSLVVVAIDQASKAMLIERLVPYRPVSVLPSLNLLLTYNSGVSFSFLQLTGGWQRWPLSLFAIVIVVVLLVWLVRLPTGRRLLAGGGAIVVGGSVGNLLDRVLRGEVTDFIQLYWRTWSFAIFNIADAAITVGVVLILIDSLVAGEGRARNDA